MSRACSSVRLLPCIKNRTRDSADALTGRWYQTPIAGAPVRALNSKLPRTSSRLPEPASRAMTIPCKEDRREEVVGDDLRNHYGNGFTAFDTDLTCPRSGTTISP